MKHIQTLNTRDMAKSLQNGGCGECQTSCQSACKTSLARRSNFYLNWLSAGTAFYQKGAPGSFYVTPL